jgi:1-acyl-sn-glycerol-3-phosphate acyltransferase
MRPALSTVFAISYTFAMSERALIASALRGSDSVVREVALQWARNMCRGCGIAVQASGLQRVDWEQPLVIVSNHQSHFDIPVIMAGVGRAFGFLTKKELFSVPAFGTALRKLGCVSIDRDDKMSALASLQQGAARVRGGAQLVVFAEGTRGDGSALQPFKKGPFYLIQEAGVQAVPIAISGTGRLLPKHSRLIQPGTVRLQVGEPLRSHGTTSEERDELRARVRASIESMLAD